MERVMSDEAKRFGIYYDADMLADEAIVKEELKKRGIKATRPNIIRFLLAQEANRIRKSRKSGG